MTEPRTYECIISFDLYQPATYSGNILRPHYATGEELKPWHNLTAAQGEVFVQFWLKPGDPPVEFSPREDKPTERIPAELKEVLQDIRKVGR